MLKKALINVFGLVLITLVLISCDSGVDSRPATFNDLLGTWAYTDEESGDELIFVFEDTGDVVFYAYLGNTHGLDCYEGPLYLFNIVGLGNGEFIVDEGSINEIRVDGTISGNTLTLTDGADPLYLIKDDITVELMEENICSAT